MWPKGMCFTENLREFISFQHFTGSNFRACLIYKKVFLLSEGNLKVLTLHFLKASKAVRALFSESINFRESYHKSFFCI